MPDARKGDLVQIHQIILEPEQRSENLPSSTKSVPYECWIKGYLLTESANLGDTVKIETFICREILGALCSINPTYDHNFGIPLKELLTIGAEAKKQLGKA